IGRPAVTALRPGGGIEVGAGWASYNLNSDRFHMSWGRLIHLGVTASGGVSARGSKGFYEGWSWKRINAVGNLGVFSMAVDESIVTKIQYAADLAALHLADNPNDNNEWVRIGLEIGGVALYGALRLGLKSYALDGLPGIVRGAKAGYALGGDVYRGYLGTAWGLDVPVGGVPF
ncbi:MAG TPA: hypothetical protein VIV40_11715, partial [Kofleriaceae bacterium]